MSVDEAGEKLSQQPQKPGERVPLPGKDNFSATVVGQSFAQHHRKNHDAKAKYDALKTPGET